MSVLQNIEPKEVMVFFEEISKIPRGSGNEKEISNYLVSFAKARGLEVIQDEALNVIIKKKASEGYEHSPIVVLQGHMDMVCEKNGDKTHDFLKDPIKLRVEGDYVYADGTTLGADNGIAVAYALAILDSKDIPHPRLEVLITTNEETGMTGAQSLNPEHIKGRILVNIDSEEEGQLFVSCAGGVRNKVLLPISWEQNSEGFSPYEIKISGLKGGHSGMDIIKQRANSNKLLGRILANLSEILDFRLISISGGSKTNAIPREAVGVVAIREQDCGRLYQAIDEYRIIFENEYKASDADIRINVSKSTINAHKVFSKDTTEKAASLLYLIPNGINTMSNEISGLVESSTNLGVVITTEDEVLYHSAIRSSVGSLKTEIAQQTTVLARALGAQIYMEAGYPEWQYDKDSKIRAICERVYRQVTSKDAEIVAIHAGLECGLFKEKFKDMDMISFGPNLYDVHTPTEHMSISSVINTWEFIKAVLKEIK